jgi:hypothetical protein
VAPSRERDALAVVTEPGWQPHISMPDFASGLAGLRRSTGSPAVLLDGRGGSPGHRGTRERAPGQLAARRHSGADRVVLSPAYPDLGASLDLLALFQGQRFRSPADGEVGGYEVARPRGLDNS